MKIILGCPKNTSWNALLRIIDTCFEAAKENVKILPLRSSLNTSANFSRPRPLSWGISCFVVRRLGGKVRYQTCTAHLGLISMLINKITIASRSTNTPKFSAKMDGRAHQSRAFGQYHVSNAPYASPCFDTGNITHYWQIIQRGKLPAHLVGSWWQRIAALPTLPIADPNNVCKLRYKGIAGKSWSANAAGRNASAQSPNR